MSDGAKGWARAGLRASAAEAHRLAAKIRNRSRNLSPAYQEVCELIARAHENAAAEYESAAISLGWKP